MSCICEALSRWRHRRAHERRLSKQTKTGVYRYSRDQRYIMFLAKEPSFLFGRSRYRNAIYLASFLAEALLVVFTVPLVYWIFTCSWLLGLFFALMFAPLIYMRVPYFLQLAHTKNRHNNNWHQRQSRRVLMAIGAHTNQVLFVLNGCIMLGFFDSNNYPESCVSRLYEHENINGAAARLEFVLCGLWSDQARPNEPAHFATLSRCRGFLFAQFIMLTLASAVMSLAYFMHCERARTILSSSHQALAATLQNSSSLSPPGDPAEQYLASSDSARRQLAVRFIDDDYIDDEQSLSGSELDTERFDDEPTAGADDNTRLRAISDQRAADILASYSNLPIDSGGAGVSARTSYTIGSTMMSLSSPHSMRTQEYSFIPSPEEMQNLSSSSTQNKTQ